MDIIVEKFKISKILSFNGAMHLKWKLRTCTIQIELEKIGFVSKKDIFFDFFRFPPNARGPPKIFDVYIFQFFEKQTPKLAFLDLANIERNKVRKFGKRSPDLATAADRFMVVGAIMAPTRSK